MLPRVVPLAAGERRQELHRGARRDQHRGRVVGVHGAVADEGRADLEHVRQAGAGVEGDGTTYDLLEGDRAVDRQVVDYARAEVQLYKQYRGSGARRRAPRDVARSYSYLATRLPFLVMSRRRRYMWLTVAAAQAGRVLGSLEHRVLAL